MLKNRSRPQRRNNASLSAGGTFFIEVVRLDPTDLYTSSSPTCMMEHFLFYLSKKGICKDKQLPIGFWLSKATKWSTQWVDEHIWRPTMGVLAQCSPVITQVSILQNIHNRHLIARPWRRAIGSLLWVKAWSIVQLIHFNAVCNVV